MPQRRKCTKVFYLGVWSLCFVSFFFISLVFCSSLFHRYTLDIRFSILWYAIAEFWPVGKHVRYVVQPKSKLHCWNSSFICSGILGILIPGKWHVKSLLPLKCILDSAIKYIKYLIRIHVGAIEFAVLVNWMTFYDVFVGLFFVSFWFFVVCYLSYMQLTIIFTFNNLMQIQAELHEIK